ncbi:MAG: hypothetical protein AAFZ15_34785 [Bacteroidota bacterium]
MKIAYIILFGLLNLLIFSGITKKIQIGFNIRILMTVVVAIITLFHFVDYYRLAIDNQVFFILLIFSLSFFIFHFGSKLAVFFAKAVTNRTDEPLYGLFTKWISYVVFPLIYIFQIATIIKN